MMFRELKAARRRSQERERHRRDYEAVLEMDHHLLRDIGLWRDEARRRLAQLDGRG